VPVTVVLLALVMVNWHPQPVDDCPCFEDAIASIGISMGSILSRWHALHWGFDDEFFSSKTPGSKGETWNDVGIWLGFAACKMVVGE
jgi:hypothetical protein